MRNPQKGALRVAVKLLPTGRYFVTRQVYDGQFYAKDKSVNPEPCYREGLLEVIDRLQT